MNKPQDWEKLKAYLLAIHKEYSERNGLDYCKNCGVSMKDLVKRIENIRFAEREKFKKIVGETLREMRADLLAPNLDVEEIRYGKGYNFALSEAREKIFSELKVGK